MGFGKEFLKVVAITTLARSGYSSLILHTEVVEVFQDYAKMQYKISPPFITANFTSTLDGFLVVGFEDKLCPGDVIILSYDRVPKIVDAYCNRYFRDSKPDYVYGGKNDWEILSHKKLPNQGWWIQVRRSLTTTDKPPLDFQFTKKKGLHWLSWAAHATQSDYSKFDSSFEGSTRAAQTR